MRADARKFGTAEKGLLPEGRVAGPMPWVIAIMMFLTVLAAAAGLGLAGAASRFDAQIGTRITIQVVEANPDLRRAQAAAAARAVQNLPGVTAVRPVPETEVQRLLEPWLGAGGLESDIPVPALIDVDMTAEAHRSLDRLRGAVAAAAPAARVDDNGQWLAPLASLIGALKWLAVGLVLLMVGATAATVVLAARAALDTHRGTIEILHLMGATDVQVARLFQRRIALDALFGGLLGFILAALVLIGIGERVSALGSELLGSAAVPAPAWGVLVALPAFGVFLAMLVARLTILKALGRML
ncbi:MAG: FtsX-like permease family protein [Alphaproteobacteria bacterium]|nr:MAG: FtsX-like permease family protein [Alphaproteobacteria bacterium]